LAAFFILTLPIFSLLKHLINTFNGFFKTANADFTIAMSSWNSLEKSLFTSFGNRCQIKEKLLVAGYWLPGFDNLQPATSNQ